MVKVIKIPLAIPADGARSSFSSSFIFYVPFYGTVYTKLSGLIISHAQFWRRSGGGHPAARVFCTVGTYNQLAPVFGDGSLANVESVDRYNDTKTFAPKILFYLLAVAAAPILRRARRP